MLYLLLCFDRLTAILALHLVHLTAVLHYIRDLKKGNEATEQLRTYRASASGV